MARIAHALALSLAVAGATGAVLLPATAYAQKKPKAPKPEVSKAFGEAYNAAVKLLDSDPAGALAAARSLEAMAVSGDEKNIAGNLYIQAGSKVQDQSAQAKGVELILASGKATPEQLPQFTYFSGSFAYNDKNYPRAVQQLSEAIRLGYNRNDVHALLAEAYFQQEKSAEGLRTLEEGIAARQASGEQVPEAWYRRGASVALNAKLPEAGRWTEMLVKAYPTQDNWRSALVVYRDGGGLESQDVLDAMRLMRRANALVSEADYGEYIEAADPRRLPGEVTSLIKDGQAKGVIKAGDPFFSENLTMAQGRLAADKADLPASERDALKAADGRSAMATADAYLGYGEAAKAETLYEAALQKGGIDADRAQMRLGIARADQGDMAGAREAFGKVTGQRGALARMWTSWLDSKSGAAPAVAAAPVTG